MLSSTISLYGSTPLKYVNLDFFTINKIRNGIFGTTLHLLGSCSKKYDDGKRESDSAVSHSLCSKKRTWELVTFWSWALQKLESWMDIMQGSWRAVSSMRETMKTRSEGMEEVKSTEELENSGERPAKKEKIK